MKLLADEGIERTVVGGLRNAGYDVIWIAEEDPGADDSAILSMARRLRRLILTND